MKEEYKEFSHKLPDTAERRGDLLIEHRCACGKLLFKGFMLVSVVEIKCKRCGKIKTFKDNMRGIRSFMLIVDDGGRIVDACEGVAVLECSRQYAIGKPLLDILPLARDADAQSLLPDPNESKSYQIKNNTLLLRDRKVPIESHMVPVYPVVNVSSTTGAGNPEDGASKSGSLYRIFNIIKEA